MNTSWIVEADIVRLKRQLYEVTNPETALRLRSRLTVLQHQLDTLRARS